MTKQTMKVADKINELIKKRDKVTGDRAMRIQEEIDGLMETLPSGNEEDNSDIDRLMAMMG